MKLDYKLIVGIAIVIGIAVYAGYYLGIRTVTAPTVEAPDTTATSSTAPSQSPPHPAIPVPGNESPAAQPGNVLPPQAGRAHLDIAADPDAKFTHFRVGQRNVKQILADGDLMWIGTSGGVIRYNIKSDEYRLFDLRSGLLANGIFHLSKLNGRLVAGTYGGGMAIYDEPNDKWDIYNIPQGLGDAFVYDVLEADNGDIWIATWSGANRVRGGELNDRSKWDLFTVENTGGGLPNDWVYGLARGKNGEVWMATEGGLARYHNGEWTNWNHAKGLGAPFETVKNQIQFMNDPAQYSKHHTRQKTEMGLEQVDIAYNPNYIVALLVDHSGTVWAGTWGGGLAKFDGKTWTNFTVADGLPANHVFSLYQDLEGQIWVGTSNGMALKQDNGFKILSTEDGLFSKIVFSMASASDGSAWIGSFGGVARLAKIP